MINGEDRADFDLYRDALMAEACPVGATESMLAERFVGLSWRLRRTERMQNQAIDEMIEGLKPSPIDHYIRGTSPPYLRTNERKFKIPEPKMALGRAAENDWSSYRVLDRLMMYERRIENSMLKIMRELERLQLMRKVEKAGAAEESAAGTCPSQRRRGDLKKQSQFVPSLRNVNSFAKEDYDAKSGCGSAGNKANQSQFRTAMVSGGVRKRQGSGGLGVR